MNKYNELSQADVAQLREIFEDHLDLLLPMKHEIFRRAEEIQARKFANQATADLTNGVWTQDPKKIDETNIVASQVLKEDECR